MARERATHITTRGSVYQYKRRVPAKVVHKEAAWQKWFNGQEFYRKTLDTKDYATALELGAEQERIFNDKVRRALGSTTPVSMAPRRPTGRDLGALSRRRVRRHRSPVAAVQVKLPLDHHSYHGCSGSGRAEGYFATDEGSFSCGEGTRGSTGRIVAGAALLQARDCMAGDVKNGRLDLGFHIEVHDEQGQVVHKLEFPDALEIARAR